MEVQLERRSWESQDAIYTVYVFPRASPELQDVYSAFYPRGHNILIWCSPPHKNKQKTPTNLRKLSPFLYKYAISFSLELSLPLQQLRASDRGQALASLQGASMPSAKPTVERGRATSWIFEMLIFDLFGDTKKLSFSWGRLLKWSWK